MKNELVLWWRHTDLVSIVSGLQLGYIKGSGCYSRLTPVLHWHNSIGFGGGSVIYIGLSEIRTQPSVFSDLNEQHDTNSAK